MHGLRSLQDSASFRLLDAAQSQAQVPRRRCKRHSANSSIILARSVSESLRGVVRRTGLGCVGRCVATKNATRCAIAPRACAELSHEAHHMS